MDAWVIIIGMDTDWEVNETEMELDNKKTVMEMDL
jgi:hypothetical protein